jgi:hypothetical protein
LSEKTAITASKAYKYSLIIDGCHVPKQKRYNQQISFFYEETAMFFEKVVA